MKRKIMEGRNTFLDDKSRQNIVSYYLMEDREREVYGVAVEKFREGSDEIEWDDVPALSHSPESARRMVRYLMEYQVTPMTLAEAVDTIQWMEDQDGNTIL